MRNGVGLVALLVCLLAGASLKAGEGDTPRQGRGFDMEAFRARMMERIKEQLAPTDDEWKVLQPKIEAAQKQSMAARMGGFGGGRGRGQGGGGGGGNAPAPTGDAAATAPQQTEVQAKTSALRTLMENKDADPKEVAAKVKELRDAREKAKADLKKAQDELREIVTPKQEAQLILLGILE